MELRREVKGEVGLKVTDLVKIYRFMWSNTPRRKDREIVGVEDGI